VAHTINIPDHEFEISFSRSSGPGGQNVNKVNSRATLRWAIWDSASIPFDVRRRFLDRYANLVNSEGEVVIHSDKFRDQPRNIQDAKDKLHEMIESVRVPPKKRIATRPSRAARTRRMDSKKGRGEQKKLRKKIDYD
jgi:ribosome-associated protein